jgi:membrane protein DedA with SNARE-associated domain
MSLYEYMVLFALVVTMGIGLPVLGDASLIAAGTLAGEGRLNVGVVLATATVAGMLGSLVDMSSVSAGDARCSNTRDDSRKCA